MRSTSSLQRPSVFVFRFMRVSVLTASIASVCASGVGAQFGELVRVVSPASATTSEGSLGTGVPFAAEEVRYQQAYGAAELAPMLGLPIREIAFRLDSASAAPPANLTFSYVRVRLSSGVGLVDQLSTDMDANVGADVVEAFEGLYAAPSLSTGGQPNGFDLRFVLSTPFLYQGGDLLLDLELEPNAPEEGWELDAVSAFDAVSRVWIGPDGEIVDTVGLVTELKAFGFTGVTPIADCGGNPGALDHVSGLPLLGGVLQIAMDDAQTLGAISYVGIAVDVVPDYAGCGWSLPGMGELLLSPEPGKIVAWVGGTSGWTGQPVTYTLQVPPDPTLVGQAVFAQGLWVDAAGATPHTPLRLTGGLALLMGT